MSPRLPTPPAAVLVLGSLLAATELTAQCALVRDIDTTIATVNSSNPTGDVLGPGGTATSSFFQLGSWYYFRAKTIDTGIELWKTDGTTAGTVMVKDINPGMGDGTPAQFAACNGVLYFSADDGTNGHELWRSDGTAAGTFIVRDLRPGSASSFPSRLACLGGNVYFSASSGFSSLLWRSNGTSAGTVQVLDNTGRAVGTPESLRTNSNGTEIYFQASDGLSNRRLWKTNGTPAGTFRLISTSGATLSNPTLFHNHRGVTLFRADTVQAGARGTELWRTDGTAAGTVVIKDIWPGFTGSLPDMPGPAAIGNDFFFIANDGTNGRQLWKTDTTTAGTVMVSAIPAGSFPFPASLHQTGSTIFLAAADSRGNELWKYSGGSISFVRDIFAGGFGSTPEDFASFGSGVVFAANSVGMGRELWISNGTAGGTSMLRDIVPGTSSPSIDWVTAVGPNRVVFAANDRISGDELWVTDGTPAGTVLLKDIDPGRTTQSSNPSDLTSAFGETLLFSASDPVNGSEAWKADASGASLLLDIVPGTGSAFPRDFTPCWVGNRAVTFFVATTPAAGEELWITDGTAPGTTMLGDIAAGTAGAAIRNLTCCNNRLFFAADDGSSGLELWTSDGSIAGTVRVRDIAPGPASGIPPGAGLVCCRGRLFFVADDGTNGTELWSSDGATAGTQMVRDIEPGPGSSSPTRLTCCGDKIGFAATTTAAGQEPWSSDGTTAGTMMLADIAFLATGSAPGEFTCSNGTTFFTASNAAVGSELWKTDLTPAGTTFVHDIRSGPAGSTPSNLVACDSRVFFRADDGLHGVELWVSDGSAAGTTLVGDLALGTSSSPTDITCVGRRVYFAATTTASGREPWVSDGTAAGTTQLCDLNPGASSSAPTSFTRCRDVLYFVATDGVVGRELFSIPIPGAMVETLGEGCPPFFAELAATAPVLGATMTLSGEFAPSPFGAIALGLPTSSPVRLPLSTGCASWLDLGAWFQVLNLPTPPSWAVPIPLPNTPSLSGTPLIMETVFLVPTAFPLTASNGVRLTFGN